MRKILRASVGAAALALIVAGCAGGPETRPAEFAPVTFQIIEHKNSALGGDIPDWTSMDIGELEDDDRFEGRYVYRFEEPGRNLAGVKAIADNMSAPSAVAREVSTQVRQVFAGAQVGDQNFVETYFENVVKTISETRISGLRKYGDFWVLKQYVNEDGSAGEREYVYYTLYTVEQSVLQELIRRAIDGIAAETEEELTARERVRQILRDEF